MLYVIRTQGGNFYNVDTGKIHSNMICATLFDSEDVAVAWAGNARYDYPSSGIKVSAFVPDFSDV